MKTANYITLSLAALVLLFPRWRCDAPIPFDKGFAFLLTGPENGCVHNIIDLPLLAICLVLIGIVGVVLRQVPEDKLKALMSWEAYVVLVGCLAFGAFVYFQSHTQSDTQDDFHAPPPAPMPGEAASPTDGQGSIAPATK